MVRILLDPCIVVDLVERKPEQQDELKPLIGGKEVLGSAWTAVRRALTLICFDLSILGTKLDRAPLRLSLKNHWLLSLWVCGREARECGQPVGRAIESLDVLVRPLGAVHRLSTRLRSGRSALKRTRPHIHGRGVRYSKPIGSGHTRQIATVDHADMRGLGTTGLHCVAELAFL
jgi:hypothetical protein